MSKARRIDWYTVGAVVYMAVALAGAVASVVWGVPV